VNVEKMSAITVNVELRLQGLSKKCRFHQLSWMILEFNPQQLPL
jgi:hypothetical protein